MVAPDGQPANLAALVVDRARRYPEHGFGTLEQPTTLGEAVDLAGRIATTLAGCGVGAGVPVALIGPSSTNYLLAWMALQLAGARPALVNPTYPGALVARILEPLRPEVVLWVRRGADELDEMDVIVAPAATHVDATRCAQGEVTVGGRTVPLATNASTLPGLDRAPLDVAGYMHTSGTTGVPKLCVQTHEYFLRLGRFVADALALSAADTVLAPLPLFHVNPLGYGVVGGLTGHSTVLCAERFSARAFWPAVRDRGITVVVLHAPPVEILKRATTAADASGHRLRAVLYADAELLDRFDIPFGLSVYGSTEVGGLSHTWAWRRGERTELPEGMARYGGRARHDVRWDLTDDGEILIGADHPGVLFSGYLTADGLAPAVGPDGWFHTGDLGRRDAGGNLVFVDRAGEAIRVKGEYVPIDFVEDQLRAVAGIDDLALWRRDSDLVDHEVVLFISAAAIPVPALAEVIGRLPAPMRPSAVVRVDGPLPRDSGVGKVRRRELAALPAVEEVALDPARPGP